MSPPTRRCGLKSAKGWLATYKAVTSYAEVWIEISFVTSNTTAQLSVTSYAEVWIEMSPPVITYLAASVTSYAEVWIEILR